MAAQQENQDMRQVREENQDTVCRSAGGPVRRRDSVSPGTVADSVSE